jgi:hypothetical protein
MPKEIPWGLGAGPQNKKPFLGRTNNGKIGQVFLTFWVQGHMSLATEIAQKYFPGEPETSVLDNHRLCDLAPEVAERFEEYSFEILNRMFGEEFVKEHIDGISVTDSGGCALEVLRSPKEVEQSFHILVSRALIENVSDEAEFAAALAGAGCQIARYISRDTDSLNRADKYSSNVEAVTILNQAGYDPTAATSIWEKTSKTVYWTSSVIKYVSGIDTPDMARLASDKVASMAEEHELSSNRKRRKKGVIAFSA